MPNPRREAKRERSREARLVRQRAAQRRRLIKTVVIILVVALVAFGAAGVSFLSGNKSSSESAAPTVTTTTPPPAPCPAPDGSAPRRIDFTSAPPTCIDPAKKYTATWDTSEGQVVTALDTQRTPQTTNNFVFLARYHYYDNTKIFRLSPSIDIIQGGSPHTEDNSDQGPGYTIADEGGKFSYTEGDLVMARTAQPNSASAQYFFSTGPNTAKLDSQGTYVTLGKTTSGLDVLKKIIALSGGPDSDGPPSKDVTVNKVTITES